MAATVLSAAQHGEAFHGLGVQDRILQNLILIDVLFSA
jgi:hypothetical protein